MSPQLARITYQCPEGDTTLLVFRRRAGFVLERHCAGERTEHLVRRLADIPRILCGTPPAVVNALIGRALGED